jgi:exonuclease SbcC
MEKYQLRINSIKEELQSCNKSLLEINSFEVEKVKVAREIDDKNTIVKELRILREKIKQYLENVEEHAKEAHAYEQFEKDYIKCKTVYEEMNERFLKGQAGILAESLVSGKECPVCGSTDHPRPADKIEGVPSQKDLDEAKLVYETKLKEKNDRIAKLTDANSKKNTSFNEFEETKDRLKDIVFDNIKEMSPSEVRSYINDKGPKLKAELDELSLKSNKLDKAISEKASIEALIKKYETEIKLSEVEIPKVESDYREIYSFVVSEEDQIKRLEIEIPEDIRSSAKLSLKIKELESILSSLEKAFKEAQDNYNSAVKQYTYLEADKEAKAINVKEGIIEVETWKNNLENKIAECGLSNFQDYVVAKISQDEVELLNSEITEYYKRLQSMKDGLEKAIKDTQGLSSIDIENLKVKASSFKLEEDNLASKEKVVYSRIKNNKNVLNEINKINSEISKDEERYNVINDISRAANGFNEERITFERYVLAAYFDEIISAANLRLNKMAGGRFVLKRKVEKGKGQKQEGLELEVFDNYTGKSRHVKTLSGGESFKASLALALGLADVVQSYAGGISLDTMFVDEGFGTLDPESLDHAIQCLIDLQNGGRLVGIISHVPELKERINVRLEVTPAKEGSKARFVI